jgi:hypothetical protein
MMETFNLWMSSKVTITETGCLRQCSAITIRVPGNSRAKIADELAEEGIEFIHIDSHVCSPY